MPSAILSAWARVFPPFPSLPPPGEREKHTRKKPTILERKTMFNAGHCVVSSGLCGAQALNAPNMVHSALSFRERVLSSSGTNMLCSTYLFRRSPIDAPEILRLFYG